MRIVTLGLGLLLCGLWMVGIDTGASPWLAWFDFLVALAAVFEGVLPAGPTKLLRGSDAVWGALLLGAAAYGISVDATPWLRSANAFIGLAFIVLAATPALRGELDRLRRHDRPSHA
jgi:hypothetical protein